MSVPTWTLNFCFCDFVISFFVTLSMKQCPAEMSRLLLAITPPQCSLSFLSLITITQGCCNKVWKFSYCEYHIVLNNRPCYHSLYKFLVQSFMRSLSNQKENDGSNIENLVMKKNILIHPLLQPFIIAFMSQVKFFKILVQNYIYHACILK